MDKTAKTEISRTFLTEGLPAPLTPASRHIQIFDNYIQHTKLRIRSVRDPETKLWTRVLQKMVLTGESDMGSRKISEIYLDESEYAIFERFEGREIRKNRYFHEVDGRMMSFDVFLGTLWGLNMAKAEFETIEDMQAYVPPPLAVFEVTSDAFFFGENLVGRSFEDIRDRLESSSPSPR